MLIGFPDLRLAGIRRTQPSSSVLQRRGDRGSCEGETSWQLRTTTTLPVQPPHIHVHSEIHRVPDDGDWHVEQSRCSRRRQHFPQVRQETSSPVGWRNIPVAMVGHCFNYLEKGHLRTGCCEPTCSLRCNKLEHQYFECRQPDVRCRRSPQLMAHELFQTKPCQHV